MKMDRNISSRPQSASTIATLVACCLFVASVGCNQGPQKPADMPDLTPCTITVNYNGAPVEGASVLLAPKSGQYSAAGTTDSSGKAMMKTDAMYEGVAPGEYRVSVTKREKLDLDLGPTPEDPEEYAKYEEKLKAQPTAKHLTPEKYSSFATSGFSVTIAEGTPAQETLELTD